MSLFNVINHEVTLGAKKRVKQQKELGPCMTESYVDTTRGSAIHGGSQLSEALKDLKKPIVDDEAEDVRCIGLIREAKFYTSRKLHSSAKDALMKGTINTGENFINILHAMMFSSQTMPQWSDGDYKAVPMFAKVWSIFRCSYSCKYRPEQGRFHFDMTNHK